MQEQIRQLADTATDLPGFYDGFLKMVAGQTNAASGIAWSCTKDGPKPVCQVQTSSEEALKLSVSQSEHTSLITKVSTEKRPLLIFPKDTPGQPASEFPVILMVPVQHGNHQELVELFLKSGASQEVYNQHFQRLQSCCSLAGQNLFRREMEVRGVGLKGPEAGTGSTELNPMQSAAAADSGTSLGLTAQQLDEFVHQLHLSLDPHETSVRIANESRRMLDCDRVSVVRMRGRRAQIISISGQPSVNRRSNTVLLLERLAKRVLPTRKLFWFPDENETQLAPQIERPLDEYLSLSSARTIAIYPIFDQPPRGEQVGSPDDHHRKDILIGGLIVEQLATQWERPAVGQTVDTVARHAGNAYRAAHNHRQLLGYPIWKWLGKSRVLVAARNLPKTIAVALGALILAAVLAFVPADFTISCDGQILPEHRRNVFAEIDGVVDEIFVDHDSVVKNGASLLKLKNPDVAYQRQELIGQIDAMSQQITMVEALKLTVDDSENQQQLAEQNVEALRANLRSYRDQLSTLDLKAQKLELTSPIDGNVITWDLREQLRDRPIQAGDILVEIAEVDGKWILELNLKDRHIGHVRRAIQENKDEPLKVEFKLAADPDRSFTGTLISLGNATSFDNEQQQVASAKVAIDRLDKIDVLQARSGVTAKILCGQRKLGYVWLHEPWEFLQKQWFKFF